MPGAFLQAWQAFLKEPFPPFRDDLARQIDAGRDGFI